MEQPKNTQRVQQLIEQYNRELMALYRQQTPAPATPEPDSRFEEHYPLPDVERDRQAILTSPPQPSDDTPAFPYNDEGLNEEAPRPEDAPSPSEEGTPPHIGYLQVFAFTGNEAEPLPGARVIVTRPSDTTELLYANTITDRSGLSPVIPLPSVDPALTLEPGNTEPYIAYNIQVSALGFSPVLFESVPVYGGNGVTQPAALVPLIPGDNGNIPRVFRSRGPADL